jgi:hypothetical protein
MLPSRRVRRLPRQRHRPLTASGGKGFHLHLRRRAVKTVGATNITIMVLPRSHLTIVTKGTTMMPKAHNRTKTVVGHATKAPPTRCCSPHRPPATATGGVAADAIVAETATAEAATAAISGHQSHKPRPPGANQATRAQILPPQGRNRARPATADGAPPNHTASGPRGGRSSTRGGGFGQPQGGSGRSPPEPVEEAAAKDATREDSKGGKREKGWRRSAAHDRRRISGTRGVESARAETEAAPDGWGHVGLHRVSPPRRARRGEAGKTASPSLSLPAVGRPWPAQATARSGEAGAGSRRRRGEPPSRLAGATRGEENLFV